jgi:CheY-like chemotaxis protein
VKKIERRPRPRPSEPPRERELLLYVEDDDNNWVVAETRLKHAYDIVRARNAQQACREITLRGSEISAILMDIELRGSELNGVELTELIRGRSMRSSLPDYTRNVPVLSTPILFVTAHGAKYSDAALMHAGGNKVIPKPVNFGDLNLALTQLHLARIAKR